jgi:uncharacterized protein YneF (UPF0154 family)
MPLPVRGRRTYNKTGLHLGEEGTLVRMKKNNWTLILFLVIGLLAGTIVGEMLSQVHGLSALTKAAEISWQPKADLQVIKYDIKLQVKLNIVSILGLIGGFWLYKKL